MRYGFLINSASGDFEGARVVNELSHLAPLTPEICKVEKIDWPNLETQLEEMSKMDILVVGGGDGTIASILGRVSSDFPPMAVLPLGTGNDLARELGFVKFWRHFGLQEGITKLNALERKSFTCWELYDLESNSKILTFTNYLSVGFSADAVGTFTKMRSKTSFLTKLGRFGNRISYIVSGLRNLTSYVQKNLIIKKDTDQLISPLTHSLCLSTNSSPRCLIFNNISSMIGFGFIYPDCDPFDNKIELTSMNSLFDYLKLLFAKTLKISVGNRLGSSEAWNIIGLSSNSVIQVDGETFVLPCSNIGVRVYSKLNVLSASESSCSS